VGVVTLRDLLTPVLADGPVQTTGPFHRHEQHLTGYRVRELMTAEPICAGTGSPLTETVLSMDRAGVNRVPVVDAAGRPVGILTRDDVLRILARSIRQLGLPVDGRPQMEPD
jgi:CBS domain-containing protein